MENRDQVIMGHMPLVKKITWVDSKSYISNPFFGDWSDQKKNVEIFMKKLFLTIIFCCIAQFAFATDYYVKNGGNDSLDGLSDDTAWATCPGMSGWTGTTALVSGDTVYFRSQDTWSPPTNARTLKTQEGVTYDGQTYGTGTKATFLAIGSDVAGSFAIVSIPYSNVVFRGFVLDGQTSLGYTNNGIYVGPYDATADFAHVTIQDCILQNITHSGTYAYGINVTGTASVGNGTGLTCTDAGAANPVVTAASYSFGSDFIGRRLFIVNATGAWINGLYTITDVSDGAAILDKPCGTGSLTGGTWTAGGITIRDVRILNNVFVNVHNENIALYSSWQYQDNYLDGVTVSGNNISGVTGHSVGILVANHTSNVTIEYNNVNGCNMGILYRTSGPGSYDNIIYGAPTGNVFRYNIIHNNTGYGFATWNNSGVTGTSLTQGLSADIYGNILWNNSGTLGKGDLYIVTTPNFTWGGSTFNIYNNTFYSNAPIVGVRAALAIGYDTGSTAGLTVNLRNNLIHIPTIVSPYDYWALVNNKGATVNHSNNLFYNANGATKTLVLNAGTSYNRTAVLTYEDTAQNTDPQFTGGTLPTGFTNSVPNTNYFEAKSLKNQGTFITGFHDQPGIKSINNVPFNSLCIPIGAWAERCATLIGLPFE